MTIHYYLSLFPIEAMIASELEPEEFSSYMATASGRGTTEPHSFVEVERMEELAGVFDLQYAAEKCARTRPGVKKNSVYLSIYRTLEHVPLANLGTLYLSTRDGRCLPLTPAETTPPPPQKQVYIYQEICPVRPTVVTSLDPHEFCAVLTEPNAKVHVPRIAIGDVRVIDVSRPDVLANLGDFYHSNLMHLRDCITEVMAAEEKVAKTIDRARVESFSYQVIDTGFYIGDVGGVRFYPMKTRDELAMYHHAWARSAMIL